MSAEVSQVTQLLHLWREARQDALDQIMPLVYDQLRVLAQHHMKNESPGHTLRATELVHEAYLKLVGAEVCIADRAHLYPLILESHFRSKPTPEAVRSRACDRPWAERKDLPSPFMHLSKPIRFSISHPRNARLVTAYGKPLLPTFFSLFMDVCEICGLTRNSEKRTENILVKCSLPERLDLISPRYPNG